MRKFQLHRLVGILFAMLCILSVPLQSQAATKGKSKVTQAQKERLVLMPLRLADDIQNMQGAMETSLVEGMQDKYTVFSGEDVAKKTREIFKKESAKKNCDETRCIENVAIAFQAELVAVANVTKIDGGYLLALSIRNVMDNQSVYSKSIPCEGCNAFRVVEKLKELSNTVAPVASAIDDNTMRKSDTTQIEPPELPKGFVRQGGLVWMPIHFDSNWPSANDYCNNTTINGQSGWRLPTKDELLSLATSGALKNQDWKLYGTWSSTSDGGGGHVFVFLNGKDVSSVIDSYLNNVTCVH